MNGAKIKEARNKKGWTQEQFSEMLGINRSYLSELENGHHDPGMTLLKKMAGFLGKEMKYFF